METFLSPEKFRGFVASFSAFYFCISVHSSLFTILLLQRWKFRRCKAHVNDYGNMMSQETRSRSKTSL